jgi:hypothetical protein
VHPLIIETNICSYSAKKLLKSCKKMQHLIMLSAPAKKERVFLHQMNLIKAIMLPEIEREKRKNESPMDRALSVRVMKTLEDSRMKDYCQVPWHGNSPVKRK